MESTDLEDAIRNAISLGGDSDTLAAITSIIAEAAYGIPDWIKDKAYSYLDEPLEEVLRRWRRFLSNDKVTFLFFVHIFILTMEWVQTALSTIQLSEDIKNQGLSTGYTNLLKVLILSHFLHICVQGIVSKFRGRFRSCLPRSPQSGG